ncbi:MAG: IPT/TIG domain-containing protein [Terriglobales bacterium]
MKKRIAIAMIGSLLSTLCGVAIAQSARPEIFRISPTSGPEGSRVEITGRNLQAASAVFVGATSSVFRLISPEELITLIL